MQSNTPAKSVSSQTSHGLSNNTPRKKKLRATNNKNRQQIHRLKKRINMKKQSNTYSTKQALKVLETVLPVHILKFIESQIGLHSCKSPHGHRYSGQTKSFALSLYHLSGKSYKLLSKLFRLPSKSILKKWMSKLPNIPGFTQSALDAIGTKVKTMNETGRLCVISFDEVSLKSNVCYQSSTDEIVGLEDFGDGEKSNCIATSAIVFMARGIVDNWKQPLAYYLVNESCDSQKVQEKLHDFIDKVETIGLKVVAVVSDIGSNFQKLIREMGITPDNPWFLHKERKIVYLFDPPHIIKAIRNNLINYDFKYKNKTASWRDIMAIYQMDSKNSIRCCPKLTNKHISPNGFQKNEGKICNTGAQSHGFCCIVNWCKWGAP